MTLVRQNDLLRERFVSVGKHSGIAQVSAMQLLANCPLCRRPHGARGLHIAASILRMKHQELSEEGVRIAVRESSPEKSAYIRTGRIPRCDPHAKAFFENYWLERKPSTGAHRCLHGSCSAIGYFEAA